MRERGRDRVRLAVDVDRELVHQRPVAAARAVGGAEVADELRGGVGRPRRRGVVAPARRQVAADHGDLRADVLQRVVGRREEPLVPGRCGVAARLVELRLPEEVEVRLVSDEHVADVGQRAGEVGRIRRERCAVGI